MPAPKTWTPTRETALERIKDKNFASTTEAALILDADPKTVLKAVKAGEIPAIKFGATWRVKAAWLRQAVAG